MWGIRVSERLTHPQAQKALEVEKLERQIEEAQRKKRRTDIAVDIKIFAANRLAVCGDAAQAASETKVHFAKQHRVCAVQPRQVRKWLDDGVAAPGRFTTNSRGGGWEEDPGVFAPHHSVRCVPLSVWTPQCRRRVLENCDRFVPRRAEGRFGAVEIPGLPTGAETPRGRSRRHGGAAVVRRGREEGWWQLLSLSAPPLPRSLQLSRPAQPTASATKPPPCTVRHTELYCARLCRVRFHCRSVRVLRRSCTRGSRTGPSAASRWGATSWRSCVLPWEILVALVLLVFACEGGCTLWSQLAVHGRAPGPGSTFGSLLRLLYGGPRQTRLGPEQLDALTKSETVVLLAGVRSCPPARVRVVAPGLGFVLAPGAGAKGGPRF